MVSIIIVLSMTVLIPPQTAEAAAGRMVPSGDNWDIFDIQVVDASEVFYGNITVHYNGILRINGHASLSVTRNSGVPWRVTVMKGGTLDISDSGSLRAEELVAQLGSKVLISESGTLSAWGLLNITTENMNIFDATLSCNGAPGNSIGSAGNPSSFVVDGGAGGTFTRSNITFIGADGREGPEGGAGGPAGNTSFRLNISQLTDMTIRMQGGQGGRGGTPSSITATGGPGGNGGDLFADIRSNAVTRCKFIIKGGDGGYGTRGLDVAGKAGGDGCYGGDGGNAELRWSGLGLNLNSTNISIAGGSGASGGSGGAAQSAGKEGGDGGSGGHGGNSAVILSSAGSMLSTISDMSMFGGRGGPGGPQGRSTTTGLEGSSGAGGDGGSVNSSIAVQKTLTASRTSLLASAGWGGEGGAGTLGATGGRGGTSKINLKVIPQGSAQLSFEGRALVVRGGGGGGGGSPVATGSSNGTAGKGGRGGNAILAASAPTLTITGTELACDAGPGGFTNAPSQPGASGTALADFNTTSVNINDSSVSATLGPVDSGDYWVLDNSPVSATPAFRVLGTGIAEEYVRLGCLVLDIDGDLVIDGSATVVVGNATVRTDAQGIAGFRLLAARHNSTGVTTIAVWNGYAYDDHGRRSRTKEIELPQTSFMLVEKSDAPSCSISRPDGSGETVLDAFDYIGTDGAPVPYNIRGNASDSIANNELNITRVQVKVGDDGDWLNATLSKVGDNIFSWNFSWDIYSWASALLNTDPMGNFPLRIHARAFNEWYWSDDPAHRGKASIVDLTVRMLRLPPKLPDIEITKPVFSTPTNVSVFETPCETFVKFSARSFRSYGTHVTKWVWDFNESDGYQEDFQSLDDPNVSHSFQRELVGTSICVTLRVFDNESTRRVELLANGVPYDDFGYEFNVTDGSLTVRLKVHVIAPPPPAPPTPAIKTDYGRFGLVAVILALVLASLVLLLRRGKGMAPGTKDNK